MTETSCRQGAVTIREDTLEDGILRWVLCNEPRRNAVGPDTLTWMARRAADLEGEVVVLTGAGEESFCAGFDLTALANGGDPASGPPDASLLRATEEMVAADATFVAMLQGYAIGAGVELACSCDVRITRPGVRFSVPVGRIGVVYHAAGLARMHAAFGTAVTQRLILLGESVDASEAMAAGALVRIVPAAELASATLEIARRIRDAAPLSVQAHRNMLRQLSSGAPTPTAYLAEYERLRTVAYRSEDHCEGRAAVAEGRTPRFRGR
jgi:enoyl-CoA hydratase/carnithine racemase